MNDWQLINQYANEGSEAAFRSLVDRHLNLVHATAIRRLREPDLAEEVSQAVFVLLARKARSFRKDIVLPGWLYRTTNFVAATALRTERRRQRREQEALEMQQQTSTDEAWRRLAPVLDEALEQLRTSEREAVILRFFQDQSLREIGALQGTSEEAARKRVIRALERLRGFFARRGISVSAVALAASLSQYGADAAPSGLAAKVAQSALVHAETAAGLLPALVKETVSALKWSKARSALFAVAGAICIGLLALPRAVLPPQLPAQVTATADGDAPGSAAQEPENFPITSASIPNPPSPIAGLRLEGETEYRFFNASTQRIINEHHGSYVLELDRSGRWRMSVLSTVNVRERFVSGFDGTNNFRVTYVCRTNQYPGSPEITESIPFEEWHHAAVISPGAYPFDICSTERFVWFALASGAYLSQTESARMPAPWRDGRTDLVAYVFRNDLKTAMQWPEVPIEGEFITSPRPPDDEMPGLRVPHNIQLFSQVDGKPVLVAVSSNYDGPFPQGEDFGLNVPPLQTNRVDPRLLALHNYSSKFLTGEQQGRSEPVTPPGQLAARYSVQTVTNFQGLQIPVAYRMEVFWPGFGGMKTNQGIAEEFVGKVTRISSIDSVVGSPEVLGALAVEDYRYHDTQHHEDPSRYTINDRKWSLELH